MIRGSARRKDPVLCYVEGCFAFFTTRKLSEQWGDDWDDTPYEHNAGEPYEDDRYPIVRVAFLGDFRQLRDGHRNSPYSVQDINADRLPWLYTVGAGAKRDVYIPAGTPLSRFITSVRKAGGRVFLEDRT